MELGKLLRIIWGGCNPLNPPRSAPVELVRYTAFVSGQFSRTSARKQLGLDDMKRCTAEVEVYKGNQGSK